MERVTTDLTKMLISPYTVKEAEKEDLREVKSTITTRRSQQKMS
jgi:hypothetical protein